MKHAALHNLSFSHPEEPNSCFEFDKVARLPVVPAAAASHHVRHRKNHQVRVRSPSYVSSIAVLYPISDSSRDAQEAQQPRDPSPAPSSPLPSTFPLNLSRPNLSVFRPRKPGLASPSHPTTSSSPPQSFPARLTSPPNSTLSRNLITFTSRGCIKDLRCHSPGTSTSRRTPRQIYFGRRNRDLSGKQRRTRVSDLRDGKMSC